MEDTSCRAIHRRHLQSPWALGIDQTSRYLTSGRWSPMFSIDKLFLILRKESPKQWSLFSSLSNTAFPPSDRGLSCIPSFQLSQTMTCLTNSSVFILLVGKAWGVQSKSSLTYRAWLSSLHYMNICWMKHEREFIPDPDFACKSNVKQESRLKSHSF